MIFAGIVAGGTGSRMKSANMPKQFLEIGGEPILVRTVKAFEKISEIDRIYIGINPGWHVYADELAQRYGLSSRVKIIDGGADRNGTVLNILSAVTEKYGCDPGDILITHDAVRPFVSEKIIRDNISAAAEHHACGTYIPSVDTVVKSSGGKTVEENLVRSELFRAQTPQTFEISKLCECIETLGKERIAGLSDTCGIFTACGIPIYMVQGEDANFKITTDLDMKIAEGIIGKL